MKYFMRVSIFMLLATLYGFGASSQNDANRTSSSYGAVKKKMENLISGKVVLKEDTISKKFDAGGEQDAGEKEHMPQSPPLYSSSKETASKYQQSMQAYYDYTIRGFKHRSKVFEWQLFSSKILFVIVILLVFSGIYFAAVQFYAGLKSKNIETEDTKLVLSAKSIEISSPIVGLIILALSLGFFYLYLVYVFPIEEIF